MASPYHQSNFETFKREISTVMTNGDGSTTTIVPTSLKSASPTRKSRKNHSDDLRTSRTQNSANRMPNKLPSLQSISTESTRSRFDSQTTIKPFLPSSTIKVERQLTNINSINRLPTLYSLFDPDDQKRIANLRRRQIYALNHLMRELEQEQFHQYCQSNNIGAQTNSNPLTDESQSTGPTST